MMETTQVINLSKGEKINLTKDNAALKNLHVGAGWDVNESATPTFDLDAFVIMLRGGKFTQSTDLIYFRNLKSADGSIIHLGDNLTGVGEGDDEVITVALESVPADVDKVLVGINIYQAAEKKQNFGQVKKAFIRLLDKDTKAELAKYDLSEDYSAQTGVIAGELYRHDGGWKFSALGKGVNGDLAQICDLYK